MRPLSYIEKDGITTFLYDPEKLAEFFKIGYTTGGAGHILWQRTENTKTWLTFGTIEAPVKDVMFMTLIDNPRMDGKNPTNEEIINPPPFDRGLDTFKLGFLDFSKSPPEFTDLNDMS